MVDLAGKYRALTKEFASLRGVAWSPKGDEIFFAGAPTGSMRQLYGVTRGGRLRKIVSMPASMILNDVARDGRGLFTICQDERTSIRGIGPGDTHERDLSWLDWSLPRDMS